MTTEDSTHQHVSLRPWEGELSERQAFVIHRATVASGHSDPANGHMFSTQGANPGLPTWIEP